VTVAVRGTVSVAVTVTVAVAVTVLGAGCGGTEGNGARAGTSGGGGGGASGIAPARLPSATAEISAPGEEGTVGVYLTVVGAAPDWAGGLESREHPDDLGPDDVCGVLVSKRYYAPLAWELAHRGSMDGYPGSQAPPSPPRYVISSRVVRAPVELLVFGEDARWVRTVELARCASEPCASFTTPAGSVVVAVPAGTAERFHIGAGWSIAISV